MALITLSNKWHQSLSQTNGINHSLKQMASITPSNKWHQSLPQTNGINHSLNNPLFLQGASYNAEEEYQ